MGMISELLAAGTAKKLEGLILTELEANGGRLDCRDNLLCSLCEWYFLECEEAYITSNPIIREEYPF